MKKRTIFVLKNLKNTFLESMFFTELKILKNACIITVYEILFSICQDFAHNLDKWEKEFPICPYAALTA